MTKAERSVPSVSHILKKISDDKTLTLFNNIAMSKDYNHTTLREPNLSSKQYYSRISALTSAGLIKKRHGQFALTALGKIVYNAHVVIGTAVGYYWKMKAIESIQMEGGREFAREDMQNLIQSLIDNHQVREILLESLSNTRAPEMKS
jgi:hypothetical protein